jgi:hypothetical protein
VLSRAEAQSLVEAKIASSGAGGSAVEIIEDATIEKAWGWVFFYQSSEYLRTKDPAAALAGNAPIIVNAETGELTVTGTAWPVEKYIANYEMRLRSGV